MFYSIRRRHNPRISSRVPGCHSPCRLPAAVPPKGVPVRRTRARLGKGLVPGRDRSRARSKPVCDYAGHGRGIRRIESMFAGERSASRLPRGCGPASLISWRAAADRVVWVSDPVAAGPSRSGQSSILRALAGRWSPQPSQTDTSHDCQRPWVFSWTDAARSRCADARATVSRSDCCLGAAVFRPASRWPMRSSN
jgi:hypothetical protein